MKDFTIPTWVWGVAFLLSFIGFFFAVDGVDGGHWLCHHISILIIYMFFWISLVSGLLHLWWLCLLSKQGFAQVWRAVLMLHLAIIIPIALLALGVTFSMLSSHLSVDWGVWLYGLLAIILIIACLWILRTKTFASLVPSPSIPSRIVHVCLTVFSNIFYHVFLFSILACSPP